MPIVLIDLFELSVESVDGVEVAFGVEIGGGRDREVAGNDLDVAVSRVDSHYLTFEPERSVEAADVLGDLPWWLLSRAVDLPDRVTEEHLTGVQRSGLVVEVQRVDAGQVGCQHLDGGVVVLSIQQAAGVEPGPGHFAVGADGDVVSLAIVRAYQGAHLAAVDVDLIDAVADHAAGEQTALLVDGQAVNALERRGGDNLFGCGVVGG